MPAICKADGCGKRAYYGFSNCTVLFCSAHKDPAMVNLKLKFCATIGCRKVPSYGFRDGKARAVATHCVAHKYPKMVNANVPICKTEGCQRVARYGVVGGLKDGRAKATHCPDHKDVATMVVAWRPMCGVDGCRKEPTYGVLGGKATRCTAHKDCEQVKVKGSFCAADGCKKTPSFGFLDGKVTFCAAHKDPEMLSVKEICATKSCTKLARYRRWST